jgi:hypothetical protein
LNFVGVRRLRGKATNNALYCQPNSAISAETLSECGLKQGLMCHESNCSRSHDKSVVGELRKGLNVQACPNTTLIASNCCRTGYFLILSELQSAFDCKRILVVNGHNQLELNASLRSERHNALYQLGPVCVNNQLAFQELLYENY